MKHFKDILVTQLENKKNILLEKKSLVNCNIFQIIAAKQCSGHYIAGIALLKLR